jgi:hypothetical protein
MAQDERERLRQAGFSEEEIATYLGKQQPPAPRATATAPMPTPSAAGVPTQRLRSLAQGATLGLADEAEAVLRSLLPGQTYERAIQDVRGKLGAYREERPLEAMGYEVGGGLVTGLAGGGRALAASAGRAGLREALKTGARTATTSAIGQGVIGGAAGAEGGLENRLRGAAVGGGIAAALPFGVAKLGRLPVVRDIAEGAGSLYQQAQRGVADLAERTPLQFLGRMVEPTDATRVGRIAQQTLPTGKTAASLSEEATQARTALQSAKGAIRETSAAKAEASRQAAARAQETLDRIQSAATTTVQRGRTGVQGAGRARQQTIRAIQQEEGNASYALVRQFGAPPEADPGIYQEIASNGVLRSALGDAVETLQKEARNLVPGEPGPLMRSVLVDGQEFPEVTLEMMDRMRRKIREPQMRKDPNVVGLSRSQKKEALDTIDRLEERYLAGFGSDEAAQTLTAARSQYRQRFKELEALQAGMNLGNFGKGKASGLLTASKRDLDELVKSVQDMSPEESAAFTVGARDWFDRMAQATSDDALKFARKFSTEEGQQRARLIFGDEMAAEFQQFANVKRQQRAAAAPFRAEARQLGQQLSMQQQALTPLRQTVQELSRGRRVAGAAEAAVALGEKGLTAAETFASTFLPRLGAAERPVAVGAAGGAIRRQMEALAERGVPPEEIMARVAQLQQNPLVRQLLAPQMQRFQRELTPTIGTRFPQVIRPAISGAIGRRLGANFNE